MAIGAPLYLIETIRSGYVIPFETTVNSICLCNNRWAREHSDFVSSALCDLLNFGLVSEALTPSSVVNLFFKKRRLSSNVIKRRQLLGRFWVSPALSNGVATNSGWLGCHRTCNKETEERIMGHYFWQKVYFCNGEFREALSRLFHWLPLNFTPQLCVRTRPESENVKSECQQSPEDLWGQISNCSHYHECCAA